MSNRRKIRIFRSKKIRQIEVRFAVSTLFDEFLSGNQRMKLPKKIAIFQGKSKCVFHFIASYYCSFIVFSAGKCIINPLALQKRTKERGYGGHQPHPRISVASPTNSFAKLANLNCAAKNLVLQSFVMLQNFSS